MLEYLNPENILFLDIETVPEQPHFNDLSPALQELWDKKTQYQRKENESASDYYTVKAGILAEFGKIICISVGMIHKQNTGLHLKVKSFHAADEKQILYDFSQLLNSLKKGTLLCAHNGKEFDFPYLCRRMLIKGIQLPKILHIAGKKPWEIPHLDTMELWKFGDYKNYTSLNLLANIFHIPTPKDDIDGSMVAHIYWNDHDLERIVKYCQKDVITIAQLFLKFKNEDCIPQEQIEIVMS